MDLDLIFLGTGGSIPSAQRSPSSVFVRRGGSRMLFDCGEGTQRQMQKSIGLIPIPEVFITHYHADHYLGLPGMLKSFDLQGRDEPMTVYGPRGLVRLFDALRRIFGRLTYKLDLVEIEPGDELERDGYSIVTYKTVHSDESVGYILNEQPRPGQVDVEKAKKLGVEFGPDMGKLQRGESVKANGKSINPEQVVGEAREGRKIVITGDTRPCDGTLLAAHKASLLVHEATFGVEEHQRAVETLHSTATEAAELAAECEVEMLALTHMSTRYFGKEIRKEAREHFEKTVVPGDLDCIEVPFPERGTPILVKNKG